jgi:hypothetical protein
MLVILCSPQSSLAVLCVPVYAGYANKEKNMQEFILDVLKTLNIAQLIAIAGMFWFFYGRLDSKIDKGDGILESKIDRIINKVEELDRTLCKVCVKVEDMDRRLCHVESTVEDMDRRLCRIEGSLATVHVLINHSKREKNESI